MTWKCPILDSHLSSYLQNNQAPTEEDEKTVLALKASLNADILTIQKRPIGTSDATHVKDIVDHLYALQCSLSRCQIILSPSRRLPKEIWGEIFIRCLTTHRYPTLSYEEAPLLLTHVSASWKAIAISTPELWTGIDINLSQRPRNPLSYTFDRDTQHLECTSMPPQHHQVAQLLRLSGSLPLKIKLSAPYAVRSMQRLEPVISFSSRIQSLNLDLHTSTECNLSLALRADKFPLLETLSVRSADMRELSDPTSILHAPSLRDITISHIPYQNPIPDTWSKLHTLTIRHLIDGITAHKILTSCECLVRCSLKFSLAREPTDSPDIPIIFCPRLEYLTFTDPGVDDLTPDSLFQQLHPPNLRCLEWSIDLIGYWTPGIGRLQRQAVNRPPISEPIDTTRNFLPQLDKLETLVMNADRPPSSQATLRFLQYVPSAVKTLILGKSSYAPEPPNRCFESSVLQLLSTGQQTSGTSTDPTGFLLPNLENVEYHAPMSSKPYFHPFVFARTALDSTQGPSRPLKQFYAWIYSQDVEMEVLEDISQQVSDHIRRLGLPFRLEIYSREDKNLTKLLTKFVFDPETPDRSDK